VARPEQAEDVVAEIRDEGGTAYAYKPARARRRVLLLEKGRHLPCDGSTLDTRLAALDASARRLTTIYRG
jgi:hypothetical protein